MTETLAEFRSETSVGPLDYTALWQQAHNVSSSRKPAQSNHHQFTIRDPSKNSVDSSLENASNPCGADSPEATPITPVRLRRTGSRIKIPQRDRLSHEVFDISDIKVESAKENLETLDQQDLSLLHHVFARARNVVIVAGAGISVAAGIPDFRSKTGLFNTLKDDYKLKTSGKAIFDASVYNDAQSTSTFHSTMKDLHKLCSEAHPTLFHQFMNKLAEENRLLRLYTQNIDSLDSTLPYMAKCDIKRGRESWPKTVQLHGSISTMSCIKCHWTGELRPEIFHEDGDLPDCPECVESEGVRSAVGKRMLGVGKLRPKVVLYNEHNPDGDDIGRITEQDLNNKPGALVIVGTSLKVPGVKRIVREMAQAVHAANGVVIWINTEPPPPLISKQVSFDMCVKGDCQVIPCIVTHFENRIRENDLLKKQRKTLRQRSLGRITNSFKVSKGDLAKRSKSDPELSLK